MNIFKKNEGFTLVELIVVIAILAILAGVAVPAYSGYIKKAELAGDQQLLAAVNRAFTSACIDAGQDMTKLDNTTAKITLTDGKITAVMPTGKVAEAFARYYAGNEDAAFSVMKNLLFLKDELIFVYPATYSGSMNLTYGGGTVTVSAEFMSTWAASENFSEAGVEALLGQVAYAEKLADAFMENGTVAATLKGGKYKENMAYLLGCTEDEVDDVLLMVASAQKAGVNLTYQDIANASEEQLAEYGSYVETYGSSVDTDKIFATNAILTAANKSTETNASDMLAQVTTGVTAADITGMKNGNTDLLLKGVATYAAYYAYTSQNPDVDLTEDALSNVLTDASSDAGFQAYLKTSEAEADMAALLAALGTVDSNVSGDANVAQSVLLNGVSNEELTNLLNAALGG